MEASLTFAIGFIVGALLATWFHMGPRGPGGWL